jgi:hypothetical protein
MKHSESIVNISKALLEAQKEIDDPKQSAENPFFKSKYAPLIDILKQVRPIYNKHGITILQDIDGTKVSNIFLHESGEWIQQEWLSLPTEKQTPQSAGSSISYARRYAISAWLGIASEEDDDGNIASGKKGQKEAAKEISIDVMKFKTKDLSEYAKNYFKELKYTLKEVYDFCSRFNFDSAKIDEEIKKS